MGRYTSRVKLRRDRSVTCKQDTPVRLALGKRNKFRKLPLIKHHEVIPEEPDQNDPTVRSANPALKTFETVQSESALSCSIPALTSRGKPSSPATPALVKPGSQVSPAGHPTKHMTHSSKVRPCVATPEQEDMSVGSESITSSSMESDMSFSSDDDDDDDDDKECSSSRSLPSPEIFRRECHVETITLTVMEDHLGHHHYMKNSTLLDVSQAESICMYHPPNLSSIVDGSSILSVKNCEINPLGTEAENKSKVMSSKAVKPSRNFGTKTPPKLTNRKPISYKKKVWFKSPIISETFDAKCIPAKNITPHTASQAKENNTDADTSREGESSFKGEALGFRVSLKRPKKQSPETAKFFDFGTESNRDMFFQMMRERSARLSSVPLFPLVAIKPTNSLVL